MFTVEPYGLELSWKATALEADFIVPEQTPLLEKQLKGSLTWTYGGRVTVTRKIDGKGTWLRILIV